MSGSLARDLAVALAGMMIAGPAVAQTNPPALNKTPDPNEIICEKQKVLGSRLQARRVCMSRAEWADLRLQDRQSLDKAQTMQGMKGE